MNEYQNTNINPRYHKSRLFKALMALAITLSIMVLSTLLFSIINQSFGYAVIEYKIAPSELSSVPLEDLPSDELITIIRQNMTSARIRTLEKEDPLINRKQNELMQLVYDRVVDPNIIQTWNLLPSIFSKHLIVEFRDTNHPDADIVFKSWLNKSLILNQMSSKPGLAGLQPAILGSVQLIGLTIVIAFPLGVGAAIYLEEFAKKDHWFIKVLQINIDNLAGIPSIIYGILGLAVFVRIFSPLTSGAVFGLDNLNGRTILSAAFTLALLILPVIVINSQEAIKAVPNSLRQASNGLGATTWQTVRDHVLPNALPGILTGTILAFSRAMGETAPLIIVGASTFVSSNPAGPFSYFTALPIQIYNWSTQPQSAFKNIASAAILILMLILLTLNSVAIIIRNKVRK